MKYADINWRYTDIVSQYIAAGYVINSSTMSGSQGEIASIDLTDGKEIIRVLIERNYDWSDLEGINIIIGRVNSKEQIIPNSSSTWETIWNDHLVILGKEQLYVIGTDRSGNKCYGTREEALAAYEMHTARQKSRETVKAQVEMTNKRLDVVRRVLKNHLNISHIVDSDIVLTKNDKGEYTVYYRDKYYQLH